MSDSLRQPPSKQTTSATLKTRTFVEDLAFLRQHTDVIILGDEDASSRVAIAPRWQGRVMTSCLEQGAGYSFGWLNRELIASGEKLPHINAFGGEDRLWLGPEGGQFSVFFATGAPFDLEHWFVPAPLDTQPFETVRVAHDQVQLRSRFALVNYSGTHFDLELTRNIRLLKSAEISIGLGLRRTGELDLMAYESTNTLTNVGRRAWNKETGLLSIWVLGMFNTSPSATIVVPIKHGSELELGSKVTSDYFGSIPTDRIAVEDNAVFLRGDGNFRCKIGVNPRRSLGTIGSYDAAQQVLTIVQFEQPASVTDYVSSLWRIQSDPFTGDAINAYNDGPPAPGVAPLGAFFELESSSPAAALTPGASLTHTRRTIHLAGDEAQLDSVARAALGLSLAQIEVALSREKDAVCP